MDEINKIKKKDIKYKDKQEDIIKKINNILSFEEDQKIFILNSTQFKKDIKKQEEIKKYENDIYVYYTHATWKYFKSTEKKALSLVKSLYSYHNYQLLPINLKNGDKGYVIIKPS